MCLLCAADDYRAVVSALPRPPNMSRGPLFVKLPPEPVYQTNNQINNQEKIQTPPTPPPHAYGVPAPTVPPPPIPPPPHPSALSLLAPERRSSPNPADMNGNNFGRTSKVASNLDLNVPLVEFPRETLHFLEKLGDGQFGEVSCHGFHMIA